MTSELRCLAVRQPAAWAIVTGAKDIENRTWTTDYRGPVVILASATKNEVNRLAKEHDLRPRDFAYGALIGVADLVDVRPLSEELEANPWAWGPHCWVFQNARAFREPIPLKGKLNLFVLPPDVARKAEAQIASASPVELDANDRAWFDAMCRSDADERRAVLFEHYLKLEDGPNALRLAQALVATSRSAENLLRLAHGHFLVDDLAQALKAATEAIEADDQCAEAWFLRSLIYSALADQDRERAIELEPAYAGGDLVEEEDEGEDDG